MFGLFSILGCIPAAVAAPTIASLSYAQFATDGIGAPVTITGTELAGATKVTISGVDVTPTSSTSTTVVFTPPARTAASSLSLTVTTPGGTSNALTCSYWGPEAANVSLLSHYLCDSGVNVSGGLVTSLTDRAGNVNQIISSGTIYEAKIAASGDPDFGGRKPIVTTANSDAGGFRFDPSGTWPTSPTSITIMTVGAVTAHSCTFWSKGANSDPYQNFFVRSPGTILSFYPNVSGYTDTPTAPSTLCRPIVAMLEDDGGAGSSACRLYYDDIGTPKVSSAKRWTPDNKIAIGWGNAGTLRWRGRFCEIIAWAGQLNSSNKAKLADYLNNARAYGLGVTASAPAFAVTSISPTSGTERGGTSVTITGTGFTGATSASVGGLTLNSFTVVNDTTITGTTKMQTPGLKSISVTNGTTETKPSAYTFTEAGKYTSGIPFRGINRAGPEYGEDWDGWNGDSWFEIPTGTPLTNEIAHFKSKGFNVIRLPFSWNRMQHTLNGALASTYSTNYKNLVTALTNAGFRVIVDCHNYVRYATSAWSGDTEIGGFTVRTLGDGTLTMAHLVDLWTKVSGLFTDNHYVQFALMNEAHNFTLNNDTYYTGLNSIIAAIRGAGATSQLILVPNSDGSNVEHWSSWTGATGGGDLDSVNALTITDSANNYAFDFHCYIDDPGSSTAFNTKLSELTTWLRTNGKKGYLTEGFSNKSSTNGSAAFGSLMSYLNTNNDVWIGITPWNLDPYEYTIQDGTGAHTIDGTCMSWYSPYLTSGIVT